MSRVCFFLIFSLALSFTLFLSLSLFFRLDCVDFFLHNESLSLSLRRHLRQTLDVRRALQVRILCLFLRCNITYLQPFLALVILTHTHSLFHCRYFLILSCLSYDLQAIYSLCLSHLFLSPLQRISMGKGTTKDLAALSATLSQVILLSPSLFFSHFMFS